MADKVSKAVRSRIMSKIRSKNTKLETLFENLLTKKGIKYISHPKLYGNPDLIIKGKKVAIFIDSCFWHKCPHHFRPPISNQKYWNSKIKRNHQRDLEVTRDLKRRSWKVIRIWEHQIKTDPNKCVKLAIKISNTRARIKF